MRIPSFVSLILFFAALGVRAEEVAIPYKNLNLIGELRVPQGKTLDSGPFVLMTHGTLAHGRMEIIQSLQDLLAEKGYASLAINLSYGQDKREGMYDCTKLQNHRHTDAMDEIGAWLKWVKRRGANKVVLLGHSRGGNQTAWFAAEHDDTAISKVVLLAPMTWSKKEVTARYARDFGKDLREVYGAAQQEVKNGKGGAVIKKVGFLHCPQADVTASSFVDYYRDEPRFNTPDLLKKIKKPVLVIVGSEDDVVSGLIPAVKPLVDGNRVRLQVVDGADHFFRDLYGEEAADGIAAFLGK